MNEENLIVVRTNEDLLTLIEFIKDQDIVAVDCETTGVEKDSQIIGMSVSCDITEAYYVILHEWNKETQKLDELETTQTILDLVKALVDKRIVGHNFMFDAIMIKNNFGIDLMPYCFTDTMILAQIVDENRMVGLKELGASIFGEESRDEQVAMKASVQANGGTLTKDKYELYKADSELMARYGAKDAILTLKLFYHLVPQLYEQGLDTFFYEEESMPLLRGPTYDLNTTGLPIDPVKLQDAKSLLEIECLELNSFIYKEITPLVSHKYPGTGTKTTFNIGAPKQMSWLIFEVMGLDYKSLTEEGRKLCEHFGIKIPYTNAAKGMFVSTVKSAHGEIWKQGGTNLKTGKKSNDKKVGDYWGYIKCDKELLQSLAGRYVWIEKLLEYSKKQKLLTTYIEGIQSRMKYNVIQPNFLQHGTTSGRYSCRNPNFQNLPRDNKVIKSCIVAGKGMVFVGADYAQLEPRVFASFSGDERLLKCFEDGDDFYSVIGVEVFDKHECSLKKDDLNSFAKKYPKLRDISKVVGLSATYGTTAPKMAPAIGKSIDEAQEVIDNYFERFPQVEELMKSCHNEAKDTGMVRNLFGRPRRMPEALNFKRIYGNTAHSKLPYAARNVLNLAVNHKIQSTGASVMNRASIAVWKRCRELEKKDKAWKDVRLAMQVHDEVILRGPEHLKNDMVTVLKEAMENTVKLPGVKLLAEPKISYDIAGLK